MLMSFHQVIPHAHHEHQEENNEVAHHHSGEAHHHKKKQEDKQGGFLSYLLAIHSHTSASNEIPVIKEYTEDVRAQKTEAKKKTSNKNYLGNWILADQDSENNNNHNSGGSNYGRFFLMLGLSFVAMYITMYLNTY
jgi:hypothetical protein